MIPLWILGILAALFLLLGLTRVRILAAMKNALLTLDLWIGPVHLRLYPPKKKPEKKKKPKKPKEEKAEKPEPAFPVPTMEDVRDALRSLPGPLRRSLLRFGRGLRIRPLILSVTFGGDPPAAAKAYGTANAAVWACMPLLEQVFDIPEPDIRLAVDFTAPETVMEGEAGVSVRIGTLLSAGLGTAVPTVRWLLRTTRRHRENGKAEKGEKSGKAEKGEKSGKVEKGEKSVEKESAENEATEKEAA